MEDLEGISKKYDWKDWIPLNLTGCQDRASWSENNVPGWYQELNGIYQTYCLMAETVGGAIGIFMLDAYLK